MNDAPFALGGRFPPPFVLISVEKTDMAAAANEERTRDLDTFLKDAESYKLEACRGLNSVQARLVHCASGDAIFTQLERIAHRYGQESILYVGTDGTASYFITEDNENRYKIFPAGKWQVLSPLASLRNKHWFRDIKGNYYAAI